MEQKEESIVDVSKRIVEHIDQMAEKGGKFEDAVIFVAQEIQAMCKSSILETLKTVQGGVVDMTKAMIEVTETLLDGAVLGRK